MTHRLILTSIITLAFLTGCGKGGDAGGDRGGDRKKMRFPVETVQVSTEEVSYTIIAVGSVEPFEIVQVTARVSGAVDRVGFIEGRSVSSGTVLVEIDAERYQLAVASAKATLDKAMAAQDDAEKGLQRREAVNTRNPGLLPGEELETWRTRVQTARSDVAMARAALQQAEVNFRDARVKAPITGVIQSRTVQTGQYVQPGAVLATLVRRDPLLLRFKVPEQDAARMRTGGPVHFAIGQDSSDFTGRITFIASTADIASRMVDVTAEVRDTRSGALRPGAFAEVRVPIGGTIERPVIPLTSVRASERGFIAYVLDGETARERILTLGLRTTDGRVEVLAGLAKGETLVIRGSEALRDGAQIRVVPVGREPGQNPDTGQNPAGGGTQ